MNLSKDLQVLQHSLRPRLEIKVKSRESRLFLHIKAKKNCCGCRAGGGEVCRSSWLSGLSDSSPVKENWKQEWKEGESRFNDGCSLSIRRPALLNFHHRFLTDGPECLQQLQQLSPLLAECFCLTLRVQTKDVETLGINWFSAFVEHKSWSERYWTHPVHIQSKNKSIFKAVKSTFFFEISEKNERSANPSDDAGTVLSQSDDLRPPWDVTQRCSSSLASFMSHFTAPVWLLGYRMESPLVWIALWSLVEDLSGSVKVHIFVWFWSWDKLFDYYTD